MVCAVFPAGNLAHAVAPGAPKVFVSIATGNYQQVRARIVGGRGIRLLGAVATHFGQIVRASRGWRFHKRQESHVPGVAVGNSWNMREGYFCITEHLRNLLTRDGRKRGTLADGGGRDRQQHAGAGSHPDQILAREQRSYSQTGRFVLPNDVITVGEHFVHRRCQVYFENYFKAGKSGNAC